MFASHVHTQSKTNFDVESFVPYCTGILILWSGPYTSESEYMNKKASINSDVDPKYRTLIHKNTTKLIHLLVYKECGQYLLALCQCGAIVT